MVAGGLKALQAMTLVAALPVALVMLALCYGLWQGLQADLAHSSQELAPATSFWSGQHWRRRLAQIVHQPSEADVRQFIEGSVVPAMRDVSAELERRGVASAVLLHAGDTEAGEPGGPGARLTIPVADMRDFVYGVHCRRQPLPSFLVREAAEPEARRQHAYAPVTFFEDGREGYDIQYLRQEEIIADILRHYERYLSLAADRRTQLLRRAPGHASLTGEGE